MISALILVERDLDALAATLAALVPAVADGVVADAVVLVREPDALVAEVAETVGATLRVVPAGADPWRTGAAAARRAWVLCLKDGDLPSGDWARTLARFVDGAPPRSRPGRLRRRTGARLDPAALVARALRLPGVRAGDLVPRAALAGTAPLLRPVLIRAVIERGRAA